MRVLLVACIVLVAAVNLSIACECGLEGSAGRIYKGSKVRANKYPWLTHLRTFYNREIGSFGQCGGSLIDEKHIATAAHCVVNEEGAPVDPSDIDVYLGRVMAFSEFSLPHGVSKIWIDPRYNNKDLSYDFAILTLHSDVEFTQTVAPVCLPTMESGLDKLTVTGWGTTSANSESSDDLLDVDVSYLSRDQCHRVKANYYFKMADTDMAFADQLVDIIPGIAESHMCAINKETGGDACAGDSGGPLMHKADNGLYYLMGVVSGSWTECGQSDDTAGLYTRVAYYADTIKSIAPNACWKSY